MRPDRNRKKQQRLLSPLYNDFINQTIKNGIKALILTPTRELAIQIGENFDQYAGYTGVKHAVIFRWSAPKGAS